MATGKPYPLKARVPIGYDANGNPMFPSDDFIRLWDAFFKRMGEYQALSNPELEALIDEAQAEPTGMFGAEASAALYRLRDEWSQTPSYQHHSANAEAVDARIQALESTVAEMAKTIEALTQGTFL